jgi:serine/threonine-protein kinase RsbW
MSSQVFPGYFSSLAGISDFVAEHAQNAGFDDQATYVIQLAVDEACSNIIEHAYGGEGRGDIELTCSELDDSLKIVLRDTGKKFDPAEVREFDPNLPLSETSDRGAGVFLMNKLMDEVRFEFSRQDGTTLTMIKKK